MKNIICHGLIMCIIATSSFISPEEYVKNMELYGPKYQTYIDKNTGPGIYIKETEKSTVAQIIEVKNININ